MNVIKSCFIILVTLLAACNSININQSEVIYRLTPSVHEGDVDRSVNILIKRMEEYSSSFLSSIRYEKKSDGLYLIFKNHLPNESTLQALSGKQGYLVVNMSGDDEIVFDSSDVVDAVAGFSGSYGNVTISVTDDAGERVNKATSANIGETMTMTLDGDVIVEATIMSALGKDFEVSLPTDSIEKNIEMANLLKHGALDTTFTIEKIESLTE